MSDPKDRREHARAPSAFLVKVAAKDAGEMAERFATNISRGGVFLRTRVPQPLGARLELEIRLGDGGRAIKALGVVRFVQPEDRQARPPVAPGMGVQFLELDESSRALVEEICVAAEQLGRAPAMAEVLAFDPPPSRAPWAATSNAPAKTPTPAPGSVPPPSPQLSSALIEAPEPARARVAPPPPPPEEDEVLDIDDVGVDVEELPPALALQEAAAAAEAREAAELQRLVAEAAAQAEAARLAEEAAAQAEEHRLAAEAAARAEAERLAEEAAARAEAARLEAEARAQAEAARLEAEARAQAEAARLEAEARAQAEAARRAAEAAALAEEQRVAAELAAQAEATRLAAVAAAEDEAARVAAERAVQAEATRLAAEAAAHAAPLPEADDVTLEVTDDVTVEVADDVDVAFTATPGPAPAAPAPVVAPAPLAATPGPASIAIPLVAAVDDSTAGVDALLAELPPPAPVTPTPPPVVLAKSTTPAAPLLDRATLALPGLQPGFVPTKTGPIIGIDLGTTYSCAAIVKNGKAQALMSREGYSTIPSILALTPRGKLVVGHPAKSQMLTNPRQTVYGAKRLIGRPFQSPVVEAVKERFFYEIVDGPNGNAAVALGGAILTLEEISAFVLREVREVAQNALGQPVHRAVITCPAFYNELQREAVREAGRIAGLHVERIINEPTAAALAYGYGKGVEKRILIYDLGGGTFDASVLELHDTVFEVVSTGGDTFLGGVDFDNQLVDHLLAEFQVKYGKPFQGDRVSLQRVTDAAELCKCALSERESHRVHVPFVTMIDGKPYDLDVTVTRKQLQELTAPLIERTISVCTDVLAAKNLSAADIDDIVLVGGMSRMPLVRDRLKGFFGKDVHKGVHPDEAVALGAALLAHSLDQAEGVVLIDVVPMSIGIGLPGGRCKKVIERNQSLPTTRSYAVATFKDDQTTLDLQVFQGESEQAIENEFLGTLKITGLPRAPKGAVKVAVTFHLSAECLLTVTARELSTNRAATAVMSTKTTPAELRQQLGLKAPQPGDAAIVAGLAASDGRVSVAPKGISRVFGFFRKLFGGG